MAFSKVPSETHSVLLDRSNGSMSTVCLSNLPAGQSYKSSAHVVNNSTPQLTFYASRNCSGGGQSSGFIDVNKDNLVNVWVSWRTYHPYWGHPNLAG